MANSERQDVEGHRFEAQYSEETLNEVIPRIKDRALHPDSDLIPDIQGILSEAGVTMLYCDPPKGFPLHGLTYWVNDAPVIVVTARRRADGFVVWAIFHELGHALNDKCTGGTYGMAKTKKEKQREDRIANAFAKETLFGKAGLSPFYGLTNPWEIERVAAKVGVSPGVAVFAMHRYKMLDYNRCNGLLVDVTTGKFR